MLNKIKKNLRLNDYQESISNFIVGKDSKDPYSTIESALEAASLVATSTNPVMVYVKPGQYTESNRLTIPAYTFLQSTIYPVSDWPGYGSLVLNTEIIGNLLVNHSGKCGISNIKFTAPNTDNLLIMSASSSSGRIVFNNCSLISKASAETCISQSLGTISLINSYHAYAEGTSATSRFLLQSGGSFFGWSSEIGGAHSGVDKVYSTNGIFTTYNCIMYGSIYLEGAGSSIHRHTRFQFKDASKGFYAAATRTAVYIINCSIEQATAGGPKLFGSGKFIVHGPVSSDINETSSVYFQSASNVLSVPTYMDQLNCNYNTIIYNRDAVLFLNTQQKNVIVNQTGSVATNIYLPASSTLGLALLL